MHLAYAHKMQSKILDELGLSTSFGIGPTRILAKMGSEENKPAGVHRTMPDEIESFFITAQLEKFPESDQKQQQDCRMGYNNSLRFLNLVRLLLQNSPQIGLHLG